MKENRKEIDGNPFFAPLEAPYKAIPFDRIKTEHFLPAIEAAIKKARKNLKIIRKNEEEPDFNNTILSLEAAAEDLDNINRVFDVLSSTEGSEEMDKLAEKISPLIVKFGNDIFFDRKIFSRVKKVYDGRFGLNFDSEQLRLTEIYYKGFVRNGAFLDAKKQKRLREISRELSKLSYKFSANSRKSGNAFELAIPEFDKNQLSGLPESALEAAKREAKERGKPEGYYVFTLQAPSIMPFLRYADNRFLRRKLLQAFKSIAFAGKFDNREVVKKIVNLKHQRARLLGYKTYAEYVLEDRMAKTPEKVLQFLDELLRFAKPAAEKEIKELAEFSKTAGGPEKLREWDIAYWAEKMRKEKFDFNSEDFRPYFKLENVIQGVFAVAAKLYGITFYPVEVPVYNEDVKTFEAKDKDGRYLGLLYLDLFPRKGKKSGAWMMEIKGQDYCNGALSRPHIGIVCNFTKPVAEKPSLLTFQEVITIFHEFGHALHALFYEGCYKSLSAMNVLWDFVELPSQIMENWARFKEVLDIFAVHFGTGEKIPDELVEKSAKAKNFMTGWSILRQLSFGYLDMAWHDKNPSRIKNIAEFENKALKKTQILPFVPKTCHSCSFGHIFEGGYSAGYYSYHWAEVLEADAFSLFEEKGALNKEVAESFRKNILARGNSEEPMELYVKFRGRKPDITALLLKKGLFFIKEQK